MKNNLLTKLAAALTVLAGTPADAQVVPGVPATNQPKSAAEESTIKLSPFEVSAGRDRGYYGANTMSGTRLNSKIEDLASSITVITKEQMSDFAMLNINDIFLYEASTEGTGTYTEFSFDRNGYPTDSATLEPNTSNRIRGVSSANIGYGNFETSGRVPLDPINIESVEISRGPNANIFGLGNTGGTVNIVPASANLTRNRSQLVFRADSHDGYRGSLELNRVIRQDVLAIRAGAVYEHTGYVRKPSGTNSVRLSGMIKLRPFKTTTLSASVESYRKHGTVANLTMPRDTLTAWRNAGSPTFNNLTQKLTLNGVPSAQTYSPTTLPSFLILTGGSGQADSTMFIEGNGSVGYWGPNQATTDNNPASRNQNVYLVNTNAPILANQPLFSGDPSLTGKSIYDWSSINLAAMNYLNESTTTTNIALEHFFLNSERQMLGLQLGFLGEESEKYRRDLAGGVTSQRAVGQLYIDVNEYLPDGTRNRDLLRPYIGLWNPRSYIRPLDRKTYRAQLAYRLDLKKEKNVTRWLGMHQLSGYAEHKDIAARSLTYQDVILSDNAWNWLTPRRRATPASITNNYYHYYVGDNVGGNVDYGPHSYTWGQYPYRYGNALTGAITTENTTIGPGVLSGGDIANTRQVIKTQGAVLQSYVINDRVVTTFGLRRDRNFTRDGAPLVYLPDFANVDMGAFNQWAAGDWNYGAGPTKTAGIVVKPLRWLSLHANSSDSFIPAERAQNLFLKALPDPKGKGHDFGFSLNLFGGKLVARVNQYETKQMGTRNGESATLASRVRGLDFISSVTGSTPFRLVPIATGWVERAHPNWTPAQVIAEVGRITKLEPEYLAEPYLTGRLEGVTETEDVVAKGNEIEIFYNPSNFWTVKFNLTRKEAINAAVAPAITEWIKLRMPVWQSVIDPETGQPWFTSLYGGRAAANFLAGSVVAPLKVAQAIEGKSRPQIRKYSANFLTNYRLAGLTDHRMLKKLQIGGALRWEDKGAIGYYGVQSLPDIVTDLDPNRPIYDKAHLYVDAFVTYRTRLFADKVGTTFQLNVRNLQEGGRLQAISAYPDGKQTGLRIIDPRQFILTMTFDL